MYNLTVSRDAYLQQSFYSVISYSQTLCTYGLHPTESSMSLLESRRLQAPSILAQRAMLQQKRPACECLLLNLQYVI